MGAKETLIEVNALRSGYGEIEVLKGVSLRVEQGEILSVIGANGAGKSTLLKTIFGIVQTTGGEISFRGQRLTGLSPIDILGMGISYVPQGRANFPAMSVQENLEMGAFTRRDKAAVADDIDAMCRRFKILGEKRSQMAGNLSGGQQQVLEMAVALMLQPEVILIDEPTLGLSPILVESVFTAIQEINGAGTTIIMVEQNAKRSLEISHHGVVLDLGEKRFEGTGQELLGNRDVRRHYLGLK